MAQEINLKDGNSGHIAKVDDLGDLHTQSLGVLLTNHEVSVGNTYNINSVQTDGTVITLTNTTETPILYFQNNEEKPVLVTPIFISDVSTGGTTHPKWRVFKKSSTMAGDIVTEAKAAVFENKHFGSSNTMSKSFAYRGAVGDANADANMTLVTASFTTAGSTRVLDLGGIWLTTGASLLITCEAGTDNTSMGVMGALSVVHMKDVII